MTDEYDFIDPDLPEKNRKSQALQELADEFPEVAKRAQSTRPGGSVFVHEEDFTEVLGKFGGRINREFYTSAGFYEHTTDPKRYGTEQTDSRGFLGRVRNYLFG